METQVPRAAEGGRRRARPGRHGDVHPSACRSCRLEHQARERQVGADLQERQVCVQPHRLRPLPKLDNDPQDRSGQRRLVPRFGAAGGRGRPDPDGRGRGRARRDLKVEPAPGHRPARSPSSSNRRGEKALFCGDILHHALQVYHPEWNCFACAEAVGARKSRREALEHCAGSGARLMPCHFGAPFTCHIDHKGSGFVPRFDAQLLERGKK